MCQLMWDTYLSYQDRCSREFASNGKNDMLPKIIGQIPHVYYSDAFPKDLSVKDLSGKDLSDSDLSCNTMVDNTGKISKKRTVVDRCRSWTNECNLNMLRSAVDPQIKVIVMDRSLQQVMESYARLFSANHMGSALDQVLPQLLGPGTEPVLRAWELVRWSRTISGDANTGLDVSGLDVSGVDVSGLDVSGVDVSGVDVSGLDVSGVDVSGVDISGVDISGVDISGVDISMGELDISGVDISGNPVEPPINPYKDMFCFVTYDELVDNPTETLKRIYAHCGWEPFVHDFEKIVMKNPEDEKVHGLVGQYTVREKLERVAKTDDILPDSVLEKIWEIEGKMQITV